MEFIPQQITDSITFLHLVVSLVGRMKHPSFLPLNPQSHLSIPGCNNGRVSYVGDCGLALSHQQILLLAFLSGNFQGLVLGVLWDFPPTPDEPLTFTPQPPLPPHQVKWVEVSSSTQPPRNELGGSRQLSIHPLCTAAKSPLGDLRLCPLFLHEENEYRISLMGRGWEGTQGCGLWRVCQLCHPLIQSSTAPLPTFFSCNSYKEWKSRKRRKDVFKWYYSEDLICIWNWKLFPGGLGR